MGKRGQITLFLILGVLIVIAGAILWLILGKEKVGGSFQEALIKLSNSGMFKTAGKSAHYLDMLSR